MANNWLMSFVPVSIHAPAWGATKKAIARKAEAMFQSTRPRGARPAAYSANFFADSFNPRARVGRDKLVSIFRKIFWFQSTRPRGARRMRTTTSSTTWSFNPRARVGRDSLFDDRELRVSRFNPRARVGRDAMFLSWYLWIKVSIHAPAWGATGNGRTMMDALKVSIHAPAWGATDHRRLLPRLTIKFQSTRPRGARLSTRPSQRLSQSFNPRARVGRD